MPGNHVQLAVSVEDFFGDNIIRNLATLLQVGERSVRGALLCFSLCCAAVEYGML
jgi:hypothetical protein